MALKQITDTVYQIGLGAVNCFLLKDKDGFVLVDCGYEGSEQKIFKELGSMGKKPSDIHCLILTHSHPDHAGSAAAIRNQLNIPVIMHGEDASLAAEGIAGRMPQIVSPGIMNQILYRVFIKSKPNAIPAFRADKLVAHHDIIPYAGGLKVIHTPGHSLGHIALLLENEKLLLAGDICSNMAGLGLSIVYEDLDLGRRTIRETAGQYDFDISCFGHGQPVMKDANKKMARRFT